MYHTYHYSHDLMYYQLYRHYTRSRSHGHSIFSKMHLLYNIHVLICNKHTYKHTYVHMYIYIYIHTYVCMTQCTVVTNTTLQPQLNHNNSLTESITETITKTTPKTLKPKFPTISPKKTKKGERQKRQTQNSEQ